MPAVIALASAVLLATAWLWRPVPPPGAAHRALPVAARPAGGDFRLRSAEGPLELAALRGRVVLIYFGYTWCPDICPTNLAVLAQALRRLSPSERERVQVLFITVDPQRDTAARLAEYTAYFHPDIVGLTGSEAEIAAVARRYGAAFRRHEAGGSAMGYMVDHSSATYLVAPDGGLSRTFDHATPSAEILAAVRALLPPPGR